MREVSATLDAVAGVLRGSSFRLTRGTVTLGRDPSNDIRVLDGAVSRRHCSITGDGRRFTINDLGSRNCTFINGAPVTEKVLENGDEIRIGGSVFTFLAEAGESTDRSASVKLSGLRTGSTIILHKDRARYLNQAAMLEAPPQDGRVFRDLNALLGISTALNSIRDPAVLERRVLESVLDVAPADRASILLVGDTPDEFTSAVSLDRTAGENCEIQVSRTAVRRVVEEGVAILSNDVADDGTFDAAASLIARRVHSLIAAPLEVYGRVRGVLYLEATDLSAEFDEDLLQLVTAIGNIAAHALENARRLEFLENENRRLQAEIGIDHDMVGESPRMREVYQFIAKVAPTDSTVLIRGESGTGKELVARAIHRNSRRADKPFVAINCAAITETLLESELFGHEKGSFTGAVAQKKGKLEAAEGGVVFLDEIGELAPVLQAKLLRVLQEREFERVGGTRPIKLNVRLIAATNRNLQEMSKAGGFRQDLYYRLNVVSVRMPALRERREDIELLANYFARKYAEKMNRTVTGISAAARNCLINYDWPGNVRELENAIERAVVLGSTTEILPEDLPESVLERPAAVGLPVTRYHEGVQEAKKRIILSAVEQAGGQYTEAARLLGVHPNYLHRLMRNLNLKGASLDE
jgi:transcriptional regulator with GAF, ATPase, and Fis domain